MEKVLTEREVEAREALVPGESRVLCLLFLPM